MKIASIIFLFILTFLAVSSGITKVMLLERDVEFFGEYGFTNPILIAYGLVQLGGGGLMVFRKTRAVGAAIVAITFLISLYMLVMEGNLPFSIMTFVATALLVLIIKQNWKRASVTAQ